MGALTQDTAYVARLICSLCGYAHMNVSVQGLVCGEYFLLVQGFAFTFSAFKNLLCLKFYSG